MKLLIEKKRYINSWKIIADLRELVFWRETERWEDINKEITNEISYIYYILILRE